MRIIKSDTVALIIDIQERLFPHIHEYEAVETNNLKLIEGLKALNVETLVTEQYSKGLGPTIPAIKEALTDEYRPMEKMSFSCCGSPDFMVRIVESGKSNVIVTGIESHVCVLQTVLDLLERGYTPIVIEDCVSSRKPSDKATAIERMRSEGAVISSYESILFELCEVSGTEEFKAISKIVK